MGSNKLEINMDIAYQSKGSGPFIILEDLGPGYMEGCTTKHRLIKVKFLNTGAEKVVRYGDAVKGRIKDTSSDVTVGKVYKSNNYGYYEIIEDLGMNYIEGVKEPVRLFKIKFKGTGYIRTARHSHILSGEVKDPYYPLVCGIGYSGEPDTSRSDYMIVRSRWYDMIHRCYDTNHQMYMYYGGMHVTVDPRWLNFANFLEDVQYLPGYQDFLKDPSNYELDKDILQRGVPINKRVYSKYTCQFVSTNTNSTQATVDYYDRHPNSYFGVIQYNDRDYYYSAYNAFGYLHRIGKFRDAISAAAYYNYFVIRHNYNLPINENIPYIPIEQLIEANELHRDMVKFVK